MNDPELCAGAAYHTPKPIETERHHVYPKYLSGLLGLPVIPTLVPLCGTCHGNIHHVLDTLIDTGTRGGHRLPAASATIVQRAWDWWQAEVLKAGPG